MQLEEFEGWVGQLFLWCIAASLCEIYLEVEIRNTEKRVLLKMCQS